MDADRVVALALIVIAALMLIVGIACDRYHGSN